MIENARTKPFWTLVVLAVVLVPAASYVSWLWIVEFVVIALVLLGIRDLVQKRRSLLRNYPVIGHLRFLIEDLGPEMHQYVVESNQDGRPFNRDTRALVYRRAKSVEDDKPFGTELDVYAPGYTWLTHSIATRPVPEDAVGALRITVGGDQCSQPYSLSVLNVSAMSFGALGAPAVEAMNLGAARGRFAQNTGEGGLSRHHRAHGGDLIWQIGTGYFGCRHEDGTFDPEQFREKARGSQVKMIEIKISQGAKPGHGGILPGAKVTPEIAEARLVPVGEDVLSPTSHCAFSTPHELVDFIDQLRSLSGGKPVGFKICIGDPREFMAIVKAMVAADSYPDFIVVDGAEGGTGAAPLEFSDSLGAPLLEGLRLVHSTLVGAGVRGKLKVGASGKMLSASAIASAMALGADWCNTARGFMLSVGCLQSQRCHTNKCPTGVATQDKRLQRALVVPDKATRVEQFHRNTVQALAEMISAMGLEHTEELTPTHVVKRISDVESMSFFEIYGTVAPGSLLAGHAPDRLQTYWDVTDPTRFRQAHLPATS